VRTVIHYQLAVSPAQAKSYLENGFDFFGGFAVNAADVVDITDVADLITLLNCDMPGSPFSPDKPIDILHVPSGPFVQARQAVGPMDPQAFLGGIIEAPPFDGSGVAKVNDISTPLMWVEPARLTNGTQLWRFYPGISEPELRGVYHGVAWGWETVRTGKFKACVPSQFIGPVTLRPWGLAPVDVEVDKDTGTLTAVTIVAPGKPPEEGFEPLPTGLWAKRIAYHEGLDVFEFQAQGRYHSIPVRILRQLSDSPNSIKATKAQVCAMLLDAPAAAASGFSRYAQGIHTAIVPIDDVTERISREGRPATWDVTQRPAITIHSARIRDNTDTQSLVTDILTLLAAVAPDGWRHLRFLIQMIGDQIHFSAAATIPPANDADPHEGENGDHLIPLRLVPTATLHYARQIKRNLAKPNEGAPFSMLFQFTPEGTANVTLNTTDAPPWADAVTHEAWSKEITAFPRSAEHTPEWLRSFLEGE
jgi:hypothetical protein